MPKWERRASERPAELAKAALELCSERGVQATKVADVAARAGVTVGTVYRYFRDKDALIEAALLHAAAPARRAPLADRPGAMLPALADALRRWDRFFREAGSHAARVALSDPRRDSSGRRSVMNTAIREVSELVREGVTRGEFRGDLAPPLVARALVSALALGPVLGDTQAGDDAEYVDVLAAVVTRGMRADGPSWRPSG